MAQVCCDPHCKCASHVNCDPSPADIPEQMTAAIHKVFDTYKGSNINLPALCSMAAAGVNISISNFQTWNRVFSDHIATLCAQGILSRTRGINGGVRRVCDSNPTVISPTDREILDKKVTAFVDAIPCKSAILLSPVNNYTCGCGNDKCSKDEKSCWKCGAPIHNV